MKIISWNINGYRSITGQNPSKQRDTISFNNKLFDYLDIAKPDILCLQETKASEEQIAPELSVPIGFSAKYFSAQRKGYSGVATFVLNEYIENKNNALFYSSLHKCGFEVEKFDIEGRVIITNFPAFSLLNVYFPNGKKDAQRLEYKLNFYKELFDYIEKIRKIQPNIIICGDYNTAHKPIDLAHPQANEKISGFLPIEREKLDDICNMGYVDAFRMFNQEPNQYSWWSNMGQAREKNVGWRIDYFFVSDSFAKCVQKCYMEQNILGSDHCPIVLEIDPTGHC